MTILIGLELPIHYSTTIVLTWYESEMENIIIVKNGAFLDVKTRLENAYNVL